MPYSNAEFDQSKQHVQGIYRKRIILACGEDDQRTLGRRQRRGWWGSGESGGARKSQWEDTFGTKGEHLKRPLQVEIWELRAKEGVEKLECGESYHEQTNERRKLGRQKKLVAWRK